MLDEEETEDLLTSIAGEVNAAAIAFSVFDGDSGLLLAATASGIACRIVFDHESFDSWFGATGPSAAQLSAGGPEAFALWSRAFAPAAVTPNEVEEICQSPDPVILLQKIGLYPKPAPRSTPEWDDWLPSHFGGIHSISAAGSWTHFAGPREYVPLLEPRERFEGPPGPWVLFLARDESMPGATSHPIRGYLALVAVDAFYGIYDEFEDLEAAKLHFGSFYYGRAIGTWLPVPDDVGRTYKETVAWLLAQVGSMGRASDGFTAG
jgi:hypothetical protein